MTLINLNKTDNNYKSDWTNSFNDEIYIIGTIEPFTYKAIYTNIETEEICWSILDEVQLDLLKSKL